MKRNYNRLAREMAMKRTNGLCGLCGISEAEECHHWGLLYPKEKRLTADDLTPLCKPCHTIATYIRRLHQHGQLGDVEDFHTALEALVGRLFNIKREE